MFNHGGPLTFEEYVYVSKRVATEFVDLVPLHRAEVASLNGGPALVWSYPTWLVPGVKYPLHTNPGSLVGYRIPDGVTGYYRSKDRSLVLPGRGRLKVLRPLDESDKVPPVIYVDSPCWVTFIWFRKGCSERTPRTPRIMKVPNEVPNEVLQLRPLVDHSTYA